MLGKLYKHLKNTFSLIFFVLAGTSPTIIALLLFKYFQLNIFLAFPLLILVLGVNMAAIELYTESRINK